MSGVSTSSLGAQGAADPSVGVEGYLSASRCLTAPCSLRLLWGPWPMWRPASGKSGHFCSGSHKGALRAFPPLSAEEEGLSPAAAARLILPSGIEEEAVSLLRSEGPGLLGVTSGSISVFLVCHDMQILSCELFKSSF